ncbi:hypothetical protein AVEN_258939-1 [Araneus ventricosus]|uniref:Uncharacterized protein n=1 Tax=Araneus ventricosus TaxID=182803 RepID=A0A4Y2CH42_ARAVE|nr:hypothetical protein AVEN_258939-1 [Araneus ventricosus]
MFPILAAILFLCTTASRAGDPCPPKSELGTCTCNHVRVPTPLATTLPPIPLRTSTIQPEVDRDLASLTPAHKPVAEEDKNGSMYTEVICKGSKTITSLEETIRFALHRKLIDKLVLSNVPALKEHTLVRLPNRLLQNTRIRQFEIRDTVLSGDFVWYGTPFDGQADTILWINAYRCSLYGSLSLEDPGTVHTKGLNLLPHLEGVDLSLNHLTIIRGSAFRTPPANLSTILLSRNSLQTIEASSFQYVVYLRCIDLSHNLLEYVTRNIFASPARYLEKIDLSWNFLKNLPLDFFVNMPSLKGVDLSKNFLHTMPDKPWAAVWKQLTFLDLTGNFIDCDCNLLWLLSVLSPADKNATTTPAPTPLPGQIIRGSCFQNSQMPGYYSAEHNLIHLTRDHLMCL